MTDIVEQLRAEGAMTGYYHVPAIQRKAAAEIEWLREESERLRAEVVSLEATGAEAADEIERLRKEVAGAMILADMLRDSSLGHQERAERLRVALRRISLASQNSGTTKEFLGREARVALGEDINDRHQ